MSDLQELDDPQIGSDLWLERLDHLGEHAWGLTADILQERLERKFSVRPEIAHQMMLVELEQVTEDEFAELREKIVSKPEPDPMLYAFEKLGTPFFPGF
jgi:hypothetical protein